MLKKMWNKYYYLEYFDLKDWWLWNQTMYINKKNWLYKIYMYNACI